MQYKTETIRSVFESNVMRDKILIDYKLLLCYNEL
jgi:hypothetical protein